ncbi:hypothetical protein JAAARDRAFT_495022 [Jaapia argillacea MUCL 33604]|uniref:Uncharacterized protein n=1 Tax=Jaapia argillacea MUCL 33604 TaxID=933084 RepID=A0A067PNF7_9AGAM|nr:hypothetical protein JAAARDRAFT_495022 [Jaapia argillacea MUCL 33604]
MTQRLTATEIRRKSQLPPEPRAIRSASKPSIAPGYPKRLIPPTTSGQHGPECGSATMDRRSVLTTTQPEDSKADGNQGVGHVFTSKPSIAPGYPKRLIPPTTSGQHGPECGSATMDRRFVLTSTQIMDPNLKGEGEWNVGDLDHRF